MSKLALSGGKPLYSLGGAGEGADGAIAGVGTERGVASGLAGATPDGEGTVTGAGPGVSVGSAAGGSGVIAGRPVGEGSGAVGAGTK